MADRCELLCLDLDRAEALRQDQVSATAAAAAAGRAKALADPTRLRLAAALLAGDELCVCDLAWIMERAENLISHHLRTLRLAGLVSRRRDGRMMLYSLTEPGVALVEAALAVEPVT